MATDYATLKKGGFMQQRQKDCFSMRLATTGGHVTVEQLQAILKVAEEYGHGYIHLTARQGIEIPFIRLQDIDAVKEELAKGGVKQGVCGPRVRTITACQGSAICRNGCIDTQKIANELAERYFGRELPHKFKFGVTGCQNNCLKAEENDIGIKGGVKVKWNAEKCIHCGVCEKTCRTGAITTDANGNIVVDQEKCNYCGKCAFGCPGDAFDTTPGYLVSFGGTFGTHIEKGEPVVPFIEDHDTLIRVCDAAIDFFDENAKSGERLHFTMERVGADKFKEAVREAYNG